MSLSNNAPIICHKRGDKRIKGGTQRRLQLHSSLRNQISQSKMRNSLIWWVAATSLALACGLSITKAFDEENHANFARRANPLRWGKRDHLRERRDAPLRQKTRKMSILLSKILCLFSYGVAHPDRLFFNFFFIKPEQTFFSPF